MKRSQRWWVYDAANEVAFTDQSEVAIGHLYGISSNEYCVDVR